MKKSPGMRDEFKSAGIEMESKLAMEYFLIKKFTVFGVYIVPHYYEESEIHKDVTWDGVIFVQAGPYKDGKFFFCIQFPEDYPHSWPRVHFRQRIHHPLINISDGRLDIEKLNCASRLVSGSSSESIAMRIVTHIKTIFYSEEHWKETASYNHEMGELYIKDMKSFIARARESVNESLKNQYAVYPNSTIPVSYTHLTLPTILLVQISVVAVSLKKKTNRQKHNRSPPRS
eukprot:TRINITY_DN14229_c0_g1_i4.p1 TRINITY_DN14229_c0_g1~~TRINITY_DN14229_c0_g1_i4.p1  ORF type:complete len:240 (-),score=32.48 TRINITY_DN14229_c0_g1_i4:76-765(-)